MDRSLVWLASYPKSGNTWLRAFMGNYFFAHDRPMPLEDVKRVSSGDSSGPHYTEITGKAPADLTPSEQMRARLTVLRRIAGQAPMSLVKTHAANAAVTGVPLIPPALTRLAIHVVRDPRDVLVSYADHFGQTLEEAAGTMARPTARLLASDRVVAQYPGGWSQHTASWADARGFPVLCLRYEDMTADPERAFARVVEAMGAPLDRVALREAIERSSFRSLAAMEAEGGFSEASPNSARFFRQGRAGGWRETVPGPLAKRVRANHRAMMRRFGYA